MKLKIKIKILKNRMKDNVIIAFYWFLCDSPLWSMSYKRLFVPPDLANWRPIHFFPHSNSHRMLLSIDMPHFQTLPSALLSAISPPNPVDISIIDIMIYNVSIDRSIDRLLLDDGRWCVLKCTFKVVWRIWEENLLNDFLNFHKIF